METIINSKDDLNINHLFEVQKEHKISFEEFFKSCAKDIMNNICISNGAYLYHPIEIEFYVYDKKNHEDIHVYPRKASAGELFFHLSGMDICFKSSIEEGQFGGILIRALEREKKGDEPSKLVGGPLICKDEVLNTATGKCEIKTLYTPLIDKETQASPRQGINQDKKKQDEDTFWNKNYRFIRGDIKIDKIDRHADTFDFDQKTPKVPKPKRSYSLKYQPPKDK